MTLVLAANLSDRVYMSCDTRLSGMKGDGSYEVITDDLLKVFPLSENPEILVGCVGSLHLAQFLIAELDQKAYGQTLNIRSFRDGIEEKVRAALGQYLTTYGPAYEDVVGSLIFAGSNPERKRTLESSRLHERVKACQDLEQAHIDTTYTKDVKDMSQEELASFVADMTQRKSGVKQTLFQGLMATAEKNAGGVRTFELDLPDHHLFVVDVNATKQVPDEVVMVRDIEWGEYIARGGGHREDMLPNDFFCLLDFKSGSGNLFQDSLHFLQYTRESFSQVIAGSVVVTSVIGNQIIVPTGQTMRRQGNVGGYEVLTEIKTSNSGVLMHRGAGGKNRKWKHLIKATDYKANGSSFI